MVTGVLAPIIAAGETIGNILLVGSSSRLPKIKEIISEHIPNPNYYIHINSERAVAHGALLKAAMLAGYSEFNACDVKTVPMMQVTCKTQLAQTPLAQIPANQPIHRIESNVRMKNSFMTITSKQKLTVQSHIQ